MSIVKLLINDLQLQSKDVKLASIPKENMPSTKKGLVGIDVNLIGLCKLPTYFLQLGVP